MAPLPSCVTSNGAINFSVKIVEVCNISPPSLPSQSIPLTFLDIPWLRFPPLQTLFFFQLPQNTSPNINVHKSFSEFSSTILPSLKHSLSSTLEYFLPFAGKLSVSCTDRDSDNLAFLIGNELDTIALTVATCNADFNDICRYLPRSVNLFQLLTPCIPTISQSTAAAAAAIPAFSVQITFFPSSPSGFSIGLASHPVFCDQRTYSNFLHSWAYFCKFGNENGNGNKNGNENGNGNPVIYDRSMILDPTGLKSLLLKQWLLLDPNPIMSLGTKPPPSNLVLSTFVMGPIDIANAAKWIQAKCNDLKRPYPILLSPYIVTCAFLWSCFLRARVLNNYLTNARTKGPMYFGFVAGGMNRLPFKVPENYFGNCVGFGRAVATREELLNENEGILVAANAIAKTINKLNNDILGGAEKWILDWEEFFGSEDHIHVIGSPKVDLYDMDFGFGRPTKIEEMSIVVSKGIFLTQSRDMKGGIEIGINLPCLVMDAFSSLFSQGLRDFSLCV